jgi:hypothetical protein
VLLLAQHGSDWHVAQYMLTCNGWVWSGHAWAAASDMCRATVEPFATHRGPRPDSIRLLRKSLTFPAGQSGWALASQTTAVHMAYGTG